MLKLGLMGQHITKSLTQTFFYELSEIYNIKLSYELFDMFNQNISIEEKLKEKYSLVVPPTKIPWIFFFRRNWRMLSKDSKSISLFLLKGVTTGVYMPLIFIKFYNLI